MTSTNFGANDPFYQLPRNCIELCTSASKTYISVTIITIIFDEMLEVWESASSVVDKSNGSIKRCNVPLNLHSDV